MPTAPLFDFRPGDLVRVTSDPEEIEDLLWEVVQACPPGVTPSNYAAFRLHDWPDGLLELQPWGAQTDGSKFFDVPYVWRLARRPPEGVRFPSRKPTEPSAGAAGLEISPEFAEAVFEHLWPLGEAYRNWEMQWDRTVAGRPSNHTKGLAEVVAFLLGRHPPSGTPGVVTCSQWSRNAYDQFLGESWTLGGLQGVGTHHASAETYRGVVYRALAFAANLLEQHATPAGRVVCFCVHCAGEGKFARRESPECRHFVCVQCYTTRTNSCPDCTHLHAQNGNTGRVCTRCCHHSYCTSQDCGTVISRNTACPQAHCDECCDCPTCNHCDNTHSLRGCCDNCPNHCECEGHCFPLVKNELQFFKAPEGERGMTRLLGTELETLTARRHSPELKAALAKWHYSVVTDGSIGSNGVELVTQPAGGSQWREMIKDIGAGFKASEAKTGPTCGQHVHVDAGDLNVWDLRRVIKLYAHVEQALFDALPRSRGESDYCIPCGSHYLDWINGVGVKPSKKLFAYKQYNVNPPPFGPTHRHKTKAQAERKAKEEVDRAKRGKYHETRYKALNLHSYWHRGTIEFRHAHGTCNPEQITNWGLLCGSIIDFCTKSSDKQLAEVLGMTGRDALIAVLGKYALTDVATWLKGRWVKFTSMPGVHRAGAGEPQRDAKTGEV